MGTSNNPAKKAAAKKTAAKKTTAKKSTAKKTASAPRTVSSPSDFLQRSQGTLLPLPSGLAVLAQRVELKSFINQGSVPNPLMEIVAASLEKGKKTNVSELVGLEQGELDLDAIRDMYNMVDDIIVTCVLEPQIHREPTEADVQEWNSTHEDEESQVATARDLREPGKVYTGHLGDEDKMFIFQWSIGGTADLERFREEAAADLAPLAQG